MLSIKTQSTNTQKITLTPTEENLWWRIGLQGFVCLMQGMNEKQTAQKIEFQMVRELKMTSSQFKKTLLIIQRKINLQHAIGLCKCHSQTLN